MSIPLPDSPVKMPPPSARRPALDAATLPRLLPDVAIVFDACHAPILAQRVLSYRTEAEISVRAAWLTLLCGDWQVYDEYLLEGPQPIPLRLLPTLALSSRRQAG